MLTCERCGYVDETGFLRRRKERHQSLLCESCLAKPVKRVKNQFGTCRPHRGKFDDDDNPLDRWGRPYRAGFRLCGNSDCIEMTHIVTQNQLEG